ncbi:UNVERIFIED_CONTAM: Solanesyl diphosphate synthase 3, chloroplastic/mitochondrial [Sesamum angustifolium]|uniref:Solanesyl diphosphate synthase 3, chloroplastic/mitochondrial n=1 Tax=Sesamum angustifolium TaxID=2727405 RepID=A0AAW2PDK1_9LAMI
MIPGIPIRCVSIWRKGTGNLHYDVVSLGFLGVLGCRVIYSWVSSALSSVGQQAHVQSSSAVELVFGYALSLATNLSSFSWAGTRSILFVADELSILANRLRSMVVAEVPKLASAAEYFFKWGLKEKVILNTGSVEGCEKNLDFTLCWPIVNVLLLMATALDVQMPRHPADAAIDTLSTELRTRQQCIAEITEMIHVASLLHDDVLDDADTRRGIGSLNFVMGNKLAVLAGDSAVESLCGTRLFEKHGVTGETMQMTTPSDQRCSMLLKSCMEYYMQKTYYKTASLISNSCKAIALLAGQTAEVSILAYEYGKNLGLAYQLIDDVLDFTGTSTSLGKGSLSDIRHGIITAPILFAMEEFPELRTVVNEGFDSSANVDRALEYLGKSRGIQRTRELAVKHASLASAAIDSFPENNDENVQRSRRALVELTHRVITRTK